ncbi:MAG: HigA family addiction module antitoxin [Methylophaga sp.]|uniref:HigA family addiction module antitoxin n=1 Tax=Methylophaga sp. TaxID=2024840 RepID=UPI00299D4025|nr:HigA family addiction module antitoxin [Methylophaga sp.]MDX1751453.1 HigA family addiction module antitoxin [Methylophaga sp.]|tara:strand:- start:236 stop:520 length:285 start_codon:yes stop_codon:yes gene_type:complete
MQQHNPPHPGELIQSTYLSELDISPAKLAKHLKISPGTVSRLLNGRTNLSAEMALKLSVVLGGSPESWLQMQRNYDLWQARQTFDTEGYQQLCT